MQIQFLGATQTVTGSRYLLSNGKTKVLVDCGLFQGYKHLRLKNWDDFPIPPSQINAILLTHAHLDHSGYIPVLIKNGFNGRIFCTSATFDLCTILLPDSGHLQEEEAKFANKHGYSKHTPALPLYTQKEAELSLDRFAVVNWKERYSVSADNLTDKIDFEFHPSGHLLGAATIVAYAKNQNIAFSGDLGRISDPMTRPPDFHLGADNLVMESTYGNRRHLETNSKNELKEIILRTFRRRGTLVIPSFAVGRAQLVLYYIHQLKMSGEIPDLPVYLNSPMAIKSNEVFCRHFSESKMTVEEINSICSVATPVATVDESIALNKRTDPIIIVAASGMATGGRVLHHIKAFGSDPKNTILFVGFQAGGTRGAALINGVKEIKIHGQYWPVSAEIAQIDSMSSHADGDEILTWISNLNKLPKKIFVTHGEPAAADELRQRLSEKFKIPVLVPDYKQKEEVD